MPKVLTARGSDGLAAIHEPGADLENPLGNIKNIYFHSNLDYLTVNRIINTTVRVPAFSRGTVGLINLFAHGMGRPCLLMARRSDTGENLGGSCLVYYGGSVSYFTQISVCADSVNVYAYYGGLYCPGVSIPVEIAVLDNPLF
jgi:hypothetical protein